MNSAETKLLIVILSVLAIVIASGFYYILTDSATDPSLSEHIAKPRAQKNKNIPVQESESLNNSFYTPLPKGVGRISSRYGMRRLNGTFRMHKGIDVAVSRGVPIFAAKEGVVLRAGYYGGYGLFVELRHADGIITRYGHCSRLMVKAGDKVNRGEMIAEVGSTGRSTGNHLHWEVIVKGRNVNPGGLVTW